MLIVSKKKYIISRTSTANSLPSVEIFNELLMSNLKSILLTN
ncbi:hypothetical protein A1OE_492 [Candidatus Endolissoclinum faulkneri L2]|uniref:Uncharacterized protein n=1 Tax=Candidatus Endolissoclinum faulkneri L2 TaxID=1193729 RepID=K7YGF5_9PROT|nr:hypothetical protein A1OE_492 [Candidatus Endolissoclinum faulkneri L2]